MPRIPRSEILTRLRAKIDAGRPIIGGGAGTGLSDLVDDYVRRYAFIEAELGVE